MRQARVKKTKAITTTGKQILQIHNTHIYIYIWIASRCPDKFVQSCTHAANKNN